MAKNRKNRQTSQPAANNKRITIQPDTGTDQKKQLWDFSSVDKEGCFAFIPGREDFDAKDILQKIIYFSERTWANIKQETYGKENKSKHHFLQYDKIYKEGHDRICALELQGDYEAIFSMRFEGKVRIIGIRDGQRFIVKWFDPNHQFCPSQRGK
jgi:hypothetical protein